MLTRGRAGGNPRGERGQVIILMVLVFTVIFVVGVIVVDVGLWLAERRGMQRAADFATLAGSIELPDNPGQARVRAMEWASRNGYTHGQDGVVIQIQMVCTNDLPAAPAGVCQNPNPGQPSPCVPEIGCDSMRVVIHKPGPQLFSGIFTLADIDISAAAGSAISFGTKPLDTVMLLDDTGSMVTGCNSSRTNPGCPIREAKLAAHNFTGLLLEESAGAVKVGYAPYRGCYRPPRDHPGCSAASAIRDLTVDADSLHAAIDLATGAGGSRTNICNAVLRAQDMFDGPNAQDHPDTVRSIVILTDGDNNYESLTFGQGEPRLPCRPAAPTVTDPDQPCGPAQAGERDLDVRTREVTDLLKAPSYSVEVYIVAFGVCGSNNPLQTATSSYCSGIGNTNNDNIADRRLLKCVASSTPGTNDHYFEAVTASALPSIFQTIAYEIAGRGLVE